MSHLTYQPYSAGIMIIFILQISKYRLRELKESAQGHLASSCLDAWPGAHASTLPPLGVFIESNHTHLIRLLGGWSSTRQCSWDSLQITWHLEELSNLPPPLPFLSFAQETHLVLVKVLSSKTCSKERLCPQVTLPPGPASVHQTLIILNSVWVLNYLNDAEFKTAQPWCIPGKVLFSSMGLLRQRQVSIRIF